MERNKCVKKSSSVYKFNPYIDNNGLLRVWGWLNQSTMDESVKNSLLIPKSSVLARSKIKWCHEKVAHSARGITINQIRSSGFRVINCNFWCNCWAFEKPQLFTGKSFYTLHFAHLMCQLGGALLLALYHRFTVTSLLVFLIFFCLLFLSFAL